MGGHHSHHNGGTNGSGDAGSNNGSNSSRNGSKKGMSRSASGADIQEKPPPTTHIPVEKLAKLLQQRSQQEEGVNGICEKTFTKYLFCQYPALGSRLFAYLHREAKSKTAHVPFSSFRVQCERLLSLLDDSAIIQTYIKIFSEEEEDGVMRSEGLRTLLYTSYQLSMDHNPEGPRTCPWINKTLTAVVKGCFNNKESHSVGFVVRWVEQQCPRLVFPVHRYVVHQVGTRHRDLETILRDEGVMELGTPVLEGDRDRHRTPDGDSGDGDGGGLLPLSRAWLCAGAAPPRYCAPPAPPAASRLLVARLVCLTPQHWQPLYVSTEHGMGLNRFLHHTLSYRGPTIVLLQAEQQVVAICSGVEWRDSHQYWGNKDSMLMMLEPTFEVLERGEKMLYLNSCIRGYPKGLRAGADPRAPLLVLTDDFDTITIRKVPYPLHAIEVWGCGDSVSRERQLEVKNWQVKEAERQRNVKLSSAEWMEHPDRYLLEMAGRPQYNNSGN